MKIIIGNDHRGLRMKKEILKYLYKNNFEFDNIGTDNSEAVDYPKYAIEVCKKVTANEANLGILICGTGIGMSIVANKVKGIRCAKVDNVTEARLAKEHNNANVIALSSNLTIYKAKKIIDAFLKTSFSEMDKHQRRINMITEIEREHNA